MHEDCETAGFPNPSPSSSWNQVAEELTLTVTSSKVEPQGGLVMVHRNTRAPLLALPVMVVVGEFGEVMVAAVPPTCVHAPVPGAAELAAMVAVPGAEQID